MLEIFKFHELCKALIARAFDTISYLLHDWENNERARVNLHRSAHEKLYLLGDLFKISN